MLGARCWVRVGVERCNISTPPWHVASTHAQVATLRGARSARHKLGETLPSCCA